MYHTFVKILKILLSKCKKWNTTLHVSTTDQKKSGINKICHSHCLFNCVSLCTKPNNRNARI